MGFQHWRLINSVQAKKLLNPGGLFLNYYFWGGAVEVVWSGGVWMEAAKQPNRRLLQVYCPILSVLQAGAVLNSSWLMIAPPFAQGFWYILIIHGTGNAVLNQPGLLFHCNDISVDQNAINLHSPESENIDAPSCLVDVYFYLEVYFRTFAGIRTLRFALKLTKSYSTFGAYIHQYIRVRTYVRTYVHSWMDGWMDGWIDR